MKLEKAFTEVNRKATGLEVEVERLKVKVSKAKETNVTEFNELDAYKSDLTKTATLFLVKEGIKKKRLL